MWLRYCRSWLVLGLLLPSVAACRWVEPQATGKSPLRTASPEPDRVTLQRISARIPWGDDLLNGPLWQAVDEHQLPADLRRQLARNGFRVGQIGTDIPPELAELLRLQEEPTDNRPGEENVVNLEASAKVTKTQSTSYAGRRREIIVSHTYDQLPLLQMVNGELVGDNLPLAQASFASYARCQSDGRVELELIPEIHYGEPQRRVSASDGVMEMLFERPKKVLDHLKMKFVLAPGEMVILTARIDRPGSVGHYFFSEPTSEGKLQQVLILRVAQASVDPNFTPSDQGMLDALVDESDAE